MTVPRVTRTAAEVIADAITVQDPEDVNDLAREALAALAEEGYALYRPDQFWIVDRTQVPNGLCPGECGCRIGMDDADANECGCGHLCCMVQSVPVDSPDDGGEG